jgi:uroporphyrinogen decarboxylase
MKEFAPDYRHIVDAAQNRAALRVPLYEHIISDVVMEKILGRSFRELHDGDAADRKEYFRNYCGFFKAMGYDTVSFECCIGPAMPGSGALGRNKPGVIHNRNDFDRYPWFELADLYFDRYSSDFSLLRDALPPGMRAIGGVGNGVFECTQDVVGLVNLSYISVDDPELYVDLFKAVGQAMHDIWAQFLRRFGDVFCVCRFGDDLGFKSSTLISAKDIREHIIPQYKRIVDLVHAAGKPFLLHSCGNIFSVMDDVIDKAGIDAKHSNEDAIAPFQYWVERYGDRIGNFGGVDTDHLCRKTENEIRDITLEAVQGAQGHGGFALASGNSIPDYVPPEGYLAMVNAVREYRGDYESVWSIPVTP